MMTVRIRHFSVGAVFLLVCLLTVGCGMMEAQKAESVARTFVRASQDGDNATLHQVVTAKARTVLGLDTADTAQTSKSETASNRSFTIGKATITDESGSVPFTFSEDGKTNTGTILLRREQGTWRVRAMQVAAYPGGSQMLVDLESPGNTIRSGMRVAGEVMGETVRGLAEGMKAFAEGFEKGLDKGRGGAFPPAETGGTPGASVEEVPFPELPPGVGKPR